MPQTSVRPSTFESQPGSSEGSLVGSRAQLRRTLRRRRVLLAALLVTVLVSLALALVIRQGSSWGVHAVADVLLLSYVAALLRFRNAAAEHEMGRRRLGEGAALIAAAGGRHR